MKRTVFLPNVYQPDGNIPAGRFGIAVSRFNESITSKLLDGAVDVLRQAGVNADAIDVAWVPGAFELPASALRMAQTGRYLAVLCLGAVIRGETSHDQHINRAVSVGLTEASLRSGVPVLFGVLTCDTLDQAMERAGGTAGNKGAECARAALDMARLFAILPS